MSPGAPGRRLVLLLAGASAIAYLAFLWPPLHWAGWAVVSAVVILLAIDVGQTRRQGWPAASLQMPDRAPRDRPLELLLDFASTEGPLRVRACLELPDDLGGDLEIEPFDLAPGRGHRVRHSVVPHTRGWRPVGPLQILVRSSLGLYWRRGRLLDDRRLAVVPSPGRTREGVLSRDESLAARFGIRPRRPRGEGLEFESLRDYVRGDDPRKIDWRATARLGTPIVRQYQIERNHDVVVAVETGRLMGVRIRGTSKLDHALNAMVALVHATRAAGDRVGFVAFDQEVHTFVRPVETRRTIAPILDATLPIVSRPVEPRYRGLAEALRVRQKRRSLLVVLTDFVEGSASVALERYLSLLARRHCVLLVALRDPVLCDVDHAAPDLDEPTFYRRLVIQDLVRDREVVLGRLQQLGVLTLDLHPEQVTAPVLERYLEIRAAGLV